MRGLRRDDLVADEVPQVAGRHRGHHPGAQHQGGDRLDRRCRSSSWSPWPCRPPRRWCEIEDTRNSELTIKVTGFQWGWQYDYLDDGRASSSRASTATATPPATWARASTPTPFRALPAERRQPAGRPGRAPRCASCITGADVIHAWWVPAFGVKKDAIPGYVNEAWFKVDADKTGLYRGQCAELCGRDHGFMPIVVDVRSEADFDAWLKCQAGRGRSRPPLRRPPPARPLLPPRRLIRSHRTLDERISTMARHARTRAAHAHDDHDHKPPRLAPLGLSRPTTRTSARCTWCSPASMFFIGGVMAMVIRAELFKPGLQFVDPHVLQLDDDDARAGHDLRRGHAGVDRVSRTG